MSLTKEELADAGKMLEQMERKARGSKGMAVSLFVQGVATGLVGGVLLYLAMFMWKLGDPMECTSVASSQPATQKASSNPVATLAPCEAGTSTQPARHMTYSDRYWLLEHSEMSIKALRALLELVAYFGVSGLAAVFFSILMLRDAFRQWFGNKRDLMLAKILRSCLEKDGYEIPPPK